MKFADFESKYVCVCFANLIAVWLTCVEVHLVNDARIHVVLKRSKRSRTSSIRWPISAV